MEIEYAPGFIRDLKRVRSTEMRTRVERMIQDMKTVLWDCSKIGLVRASWSRKPATTPSQRVTDQVPSRGRC